jgi:hypothetical protein
LIGCEEYQIGETPDAGESQLVTMATLTAATRSIRAMIRRSEVEVEPKTADLRTRPMCDALPFYFACLESTTCPVQDQSKS